MRRTIIAIALLAACAQQEPPARTPAPNTSTSTAFDAAAPGLDPTPGTTAAPGTTPPAPAPSSSPQPSARNITITAPREDETLRTNPIRVAGTARTFENNVVIRVRGSNGKTIRETYTTAVGEMGNFNPWQKEILLTSDPGERVIIEAWESSAKDGSVQSLVRVEPRFDGPRKTYTVYKHDPARAPDDCSKVFPMKREAPASISEARLLVEMLMAEEGSPFPRGSGVNGVTISGGTAKVDFNSSLLNVGGSCRAQAIRASVEKTLGALPNVSRVVITADGNERQALQP